MNARVEKEIRCVCGRLLGVVSDGVVLTKCKRCKRRISLTGVGGGDVRCTCGRLMARAASGRFEISCPRCKRTQELDTG